MKTLASLLAAVLLSPASAFSFAHLWAIQEIYTNADGSVQFIELFTTGPSEDFIPNQTLKFDINLVTQRTMTFNNASATDGTGDLSGSTTNKTVLIGTANLATLYGVMPDYILTANFLAQGSLNSIVYSASGDRVNLTNLPTNGVGSLDGLVNNFGTTAAATAVNAQGTPRDFAGQNATIPEPGTLGLIALGVGLTGLVWGRRRKA
jgi:PEP-CTERM motif